MDYEEARLWLEVELLDANNVKHEQLPSLVAALKIVVKTQEGYGGFAWQAGEKLIDAFERHSVSRDRAFERFGWDTLAVGIHQALLDNRLLTSLSYAHSNFLPSASTQVFDNPKIVNSIQEALANAPNIFIAPSDLTSIDTTVQQEFGRLLYKLPDIVDETDLLLQWSAAILRIIPIDASLYKIASIVLLKALHKEKQIFSAYYAFRALAEHNEDLWDSALVHEILHNLILGCQSSGETGQTTLTQLIADDNATNTMSSNIDLLFVFGSLAINLAKNTENSKAEAVAWRFVNDLHTYNSMLAHEFEKYLIENELPTIPLPSREKYKDIEKRFEMARSAIEIELRPRNYKRLASHIYQEIVDDVFQPLFNQVSSRSCSQQLIDRILEIDPEKLVKESDFQQASVYHTGPKVDRKMIADFEKIRRNLVIAAQLKLELDELNQELEDTQKNKLSVFWDFDELMDRLTTPTKCILQSLLPDLWNAFNRGVAFAKQETEGQRYGAR